MAESWKYLIAKFLLPVFSGFHATGVASETENLARRWTSVLLVLHDPMMFEDGFDHGFSYSVNRPDFIINGN